MKQTRFWLVWNPAGNSPKYRHSSRASADHEAERLALLAPGQQFIVLKAVGGKFSLPADPEDISFVAPDPEDIPF